MGALSKRSGRVALCLVAALAFRSIMAYAGQGKRPSKESLAKLYEESCVSSLRTINSAEGIYRGGDWAKGYAGTLKELGPAGADYLEPVLASGKKGGYRFELAPERTKAGQPIKHYTASARPIKRLVKNQKSYFTDETGLIRFTTANRAATRADTPLDDPAKYPARVE